MNRPILAGMLGLALAGCTQTQTAMPLARNKARLPPVGLTPVPNIYEAINRENGRLDPASLRPENGPVLANLGAGPGGPAGQGPGANGGPAPCVTRCPDPACAPVAATPRPQETVLEPLPGHGLASAPAPAPSPPPQAPETDIHRTSAIPVAAGPGAASLPDPSIAAVPDAVPLPPPVESQELVPGSPPPADLPPVDLALPAPVSMPTPEAGGPDPSIGATPDAVPLPVLPPTQEPAALLPAAPPAPASLPLELPPSDPQAPPAVDSKPPDAVPPLSATEMPASPVASNPGAPASPVPLATVDSELVKASTDPTAMHSEGTPVKLKEAGKAAARVGDEVITINELANAVKERLGSLPNGYQPNREEKMMLTSRVLDSLIERSALLQEAKRELKDPKKLEQFMKLADKVFREEEIPPLLRKMAVTNEYELKQKFTEHGKSLDALREAYKHDFLAKGFLEQKLKPKMFVTVSEMRDYYNAHLDDYRLPEQWTWREVVVEVDKHPSRVEARKKADAILARLRRNDDFAKVASEESEGPNRAAGGLWETAPDSYAIATVNEAVRSLPIGQVSPVLESPSSYHIIRVDARRPAGPATFAEVQDKIRDLVRRRKVERESAAFLDKLLAQTVVTTILDKTTYPPAASRATLNKAKAAVATNSNPEGSEARTP